MRGANPINYKSNVLPSLLGAESLQPILEGSIAERLIVGGIDINDPLDCQALINCLPIAELLKSRRIQDITDNRMKARIERNKVVSIKTGYIGSGLLFAVLFPRILKEVNKSSGVFGQLGYNQQMTMICAWIHSKINYNCFMYENIALFDIVEGHRLIHLSLRQLRDMGYIQELTGIEVHKLTGKHIKPGNNRKYYKLTRQGEQIFKDVLKAVLKSFEKATKQFFDIPLLEKLGKEE